MVMQKIRRLYISKIQSMSIQQVEAKRKPVMCIYRFPSKSANRNVKLLFLLT